MNRALLLLLAMMLPTGALAGPIGDRIAARHDHSLLRSAWDNSLTVNPIDLFTGTINIEYERAVANKVGIYGGVNFLIMRGVLMSSDARNRFAFGPEVGARLYLIGRAPGGLWLGPYVNAAYVRNIGVAGDAPSGGDALSLGGGGMAGINLLFGQFNLSLGAGAGYYDWGVVTSGTRDPSSSGFTPRLRLALGAVF